MGGLNMNKEIIDKKKMTGKLITGTLGKALPAWKEISDYLFKCYDFDPVLFTNKKGEKVIRFRKSGKTLITLTPDKGKFVSLIVLGKKEVEKAEAILPQLSVKMKKLFLSTEQFHDGRWLWIEVANKSVIKDIQILLSTKRKPS
jgi:hypothetical protein